MARVSVLLDPVLTSPPPASVPALPTPPPSPASISIVLTSSNPSNPPLQGGLEPKFVVPAAYFYALGAKSPPQLSPLQRYKAAVTARAEYLDQSFQTAIACGYLDTDGANLKPITKGAAVPGGAPINEPQAVRRLTALSAVFVRGSDPQIELSKVSALVGRWLANTSSLVDFDNDFWNSEIASTTNVPSDYFMLLLDVITGSNTDFSNYLLSLPIRTSSDIKAVTDADWVVIFTNHADWLPASTAPGSTAQRTSAFIVFLRKLLTVGFAKPAPGTTTVDESPTFGGANDVLWRFFSNNTAFTLGAGIDKTTIEPILAGLFPNDIGAQKWVLQALTVLNNLYMMTSPLTLSQGLQFSYMEAMYTRGFTTPDAVMELTRSQFKFALAGTVAYPRGADIWEAASALPFMTNDLSSWPGQGFHTVNGRDLVNCIPPAHLHPLGPVEYLSEMLAATSGTAVLGDAVAGRRGPLSNLAVTPANLGMQLPLIDLVLESLEALGSSSAAIGAVYDTEHGLVASVDHNEDDDLLLTVPQHSTPSTKISQPTTYKTLDSCFTSPMLPYSKTLDVCRSYLEELCTTRFATMHCFRRNVTELPQDSTHTPADFQGYRWRCPVTFEIALEYMNISNDEYSGFFSGSFPVAQISHLFGLENSSANDTPWLATACTLSGFLQATSLTYCEFLELWRSGFLTFTEFGGGYRPSQDFPDCSPCCSAKVIIQFPDVDIDEYPAQMLKLMYFIRLWRKVNHGRGRKAISFASLADICSVLGLYDASGTHINPDIVRQIASLLMLVDRFGLPWGFDRSVTTLGADRTKILGLWLNPVSGSISTTWAVTQMLGSIGHYAEREYKCRRREAEFVKILKRNLDSLAALAGFTGTRAWYSQPTCTIRFVEVLVKIYTSKFTVGEILFLCTGQRHLEGDDPFPMPSASESHDAPLDLPDDDTLALWALRRKLLETNNCEGAHAS